jgi:aspartate racemase
LQALAIPCNTAHYWYDALCAAVPIPILHIVDAALAELQRRGMSPQGRPKGESASAQREGSPVSGPVGLLATSGTVHAAVYPQRAPHLHWIEPSAAELDTLIMPGIHAIKAQRLAEGRALLGAAAEALAARGARVIVLGCTEVPVALDPIADTERLLGVPLLDATAALAARCVAWARHGQTPALQGPA